MTVPERDYDDLAGLDLRGKVILYLSGGPSSIPGPLRSHYQPAGERWKFLERAGVVGALQIQNPRSMDIPWARSSLARLRPSMSLADAAPLQNLASVRKHLHAGSYRQKQAVGSL